MKVRDCFLWRHLRNRNFAGYKFRRQHPFDGYVLDFYFGNDFKNVFFIRSTRSAWETVRGSVVTM